MTLFIAICGFLGSWLLVAGPVWQAAIELQEEEIDREAIEKARSSTRTTSTVSPWWWLLPPVAIAKQRRIALADRKAFNEALPPEQFKQAVSFLNKANGWMVVALGAYLLAVAETWNLTQLIRFPAWAFWVAIFVLPIIAVANAAVRMKFTNHVLEERGKG